MMADTLHPWRALFWEPVAGTGERIMAGVVYRYDDTWACARILRNDVLDSLYGKAAKGVRDLLDFALDLYRDAAKAEDALEPLGAPIAGLHPGPLRMTAANSRSELLRIAALQYSSLANLDKLDPEEDSDQAAGEEAAKRFSTDVRELITHQPPELAQYFQRTAHLIEGGEPVRFGYASPRLLAHFSVISPARSGAGLRDARGRLFELQNGKRLAGFDTAALISGFPADDDPTLSPKQQERNKQLKAELRQEAENVGITFSPVSSATSGAKMLLELEGVEI